MAENNHTGYMYRAHLPQQEDLVIAKVISVRESDSELELLEYGNHKALMAHTQLSRKRIRSLRSLIRVNEEMILRVYNIDGSNIDLTKQGVDAKESADFRKTYQEANALFQLCRHIAPMIQKDWQELYKNMIFPIYDQMELESSNSGPDVSSSETEDLFLSDDELDADIQEKLQDELRCDTPRTPYQLLHKMAHDKQALHSYFLEKVSRAFLSDKQLSIFIDAIQNRVYPCPIFEISALISLLCSKGDGILRIQKSLKAALLTAHTDIDLKISCVSSPFYLIKVICNARDQNPKEHLIIACEQIKNTFATLCDLIPSENKITNTSQGQFKIKEIFPMKHPKKIPQKLQKISTKTK